MDQLRRLRQSLAVPHLVRRARHQLVELANMLALVPRLRLAQVKLNIRAHQNNARTACVVVIGCKKFQSLFENSSRRLLLVKGSECFLVFYLEQDALKWYCTQLVHSLHIGIVMLSCAERKNLAKSNDLASEEMSETSFVGCFGKLCCYGLVLCQI